jgi:hypothetical protein
VIEDGKYIEFVKHLEKLTGLKFNQTKVRDFVV